MAPELSYYVEGQNEDTDEYSNAVDIWAVGCILYKLITKRPPFPPGLSLKKFCLKQYSFPSEEINLFSLIGRIFIHRLLTPEPTRRPSADRALEDQWVLARVLDPTPDHLDLMDCTLSHDQGGVSSMLDGASSAPYDTAISHAGNMPTSIISWPLTECPYTDCTYRKACFTHEVRSP